MLICNRPRVGDCALFQGNLAFLLRNSGFNEGDADAGNTVPEQDRGKKGGAILEFLPKRVKKLLKILAPSMKNALN